MDRIRTVVVDDEPLARERIRLTLEAEPDIAIVAEAEDGLSAITAIQEFAPDLVILDVQMPGLDGFEIIRAVGAEDMPLIVFVTAYDGFAIHAFDVNAADYVLKPVAPERLRTAIDRARKRLQNRAPHLETLLDLLARTAPTRYTDRLVANEGSKLELVWVRQIDWIEASGNYSIVHIAETTRRVRMSMSTLESRLDPGMFVRIHRSAIVNLNAILDIEPLYQGDYLVRLRSGKRLTSTRTYRRALLSAFGRDIADEN